MNFKLWILLFFIAAIKLSETKLVNYHFEGFHVFYLIEDSSLLYDIQCRDWYTVLKKFVHPYRMDAVRTWYKMYANWISYYLNAYPMWIEQPTDWDDRNNASDNSKIVQYNARMYWRFHSLMRHKATVSPKCWKRNTSIYTSVTFVQIYHAPGEPYEIPCYICQKRFERNGRPKVFYYVKSRNIFSLAANFTAASYDNSFNNDVKRVYYYAFESMAAINLKYNDPTGKQQPTEKYPGVPPPLDSVGVEWQMDQAYGENLLNRGGDALYMNPSVQTELTLPNYGTFFCMNESPDPQDRPEVIINVDVLTKTKKMNILTDNQIEVVMVNDPMPVTETKRNYKCAVDWEEWSCPSVCDPKQTKVYDVYRKGHISVRKLNPLIHLRPSHNKEAWDEWRAVDAYLSTSPYRERGIALYSSLWLSFPNAYKEFKSTCGLQYKDVKTYLQVNSTRTFSCDEKRQCEEKERKSRMFTSLDDETSGDGGGDDVTPDDGSSGADDKPCPIDIVKHEFVTVSKIGQGKSKLESFIHLKYYEFVCVDESKKGISWKVDGKPVTSDCSTAAERFVFKRGNRLHIHRPMDKLQLTVTCSDKKTKLGEMKMVFKKLIDWRPTIILCKNKCCGMQ